MPGQLTTCINRKRFLSYAIAVTTFCNLLVSAACAQSPPPNTFLPTTWTLTILATGTQANPAGYTVKAEPTTGGCPYTEPPNPPPDPQRLKVCQGDKVQWVAQTKEDSSHKKHSEMAIFHEDSILLDEYQNPHQGFHASDGKATPGGMIDSNAILDVEHKYYVAIFDKQTNHWYVDDPKIIIGKGGPIELLDRIQIECGQLLTFITGERAKDQATETCRKADQKLRELLKLK